MDHHDCYLQEGDSGVNSQLNKKPNWSSYDIRKGEREKNEIKKTDFKFFFMMVMMMKESKSEITKELTGLLACWLVATP